MLELIDRESTMTGPQAHHGADQSSSPLSSALFPQPTNALDVVELSEASRKPIVSLIGGEKISGGSDMIRYLEPWQRPESVAIQSDRIIARFAPTPIRWRPGRTLVGWTAPGAAAAPEHATLPPYITPVHGVDPVIASHFVDHLIVRNQSELEKYGRPRYTNGMHLVGTSIDDAACRGLADAHGVLDTINLEFAADLHADFVNEPIAFKLLTAAHTLSDQALDRPLEVYDLLRTIDSLVLPNVRRAGLTLGHSLPRGHDLLLLPVSYYHADDRTFVRSARMLKISPIAAAEFLAAVSLHLATVGFARDDADIVTLPDLLESIVPASEMANWCRDRAAANTFTRLCITALPTLAGLSLGMRTMLDLDGPVYEPARHSFLRHGIDPARFLPVLDFWTYRLLHAMREHLRDHALSDDFPVTWKHGYKVQLRHEIDNISVFNAELPKEAAPISVLEVFSGSDRPAVQKYIAALPDASLSTWERKKLWSRFRHFVSH